jgi:hypothetical protein
MLEIAAEEAILVDSHFESHRASILDRGRTKLLCE